MTDASTGLAARLWQESKALHVQAERSGVIADMLHGRATRRGYVLFLRNLWPAYAALEAGLHAHRLSAGVRLVARPETYRLAAIEADLHSLAGAAWRDLPLLPAGVRYGATVARAADSGGSLLIAHAYVRYLGDLSGGQILQALLARTLGLGPEALAFYRFDAIADMAAYKTGYRHWLDAAGREIGAAAAVAREAGAAFRLNMDVSVAVADMCLSEHQEHS